MIKKKILKIKNIKNNEHRDSDASNNETISTDPLGMWTGVPEDPTEKPVQDADDL